MDNLLFCKYDLSNLLQNQTKLIKEEINSKNTEYILGIDETDYIEFLFNKYCINRIELDLANIKMGHKEIDIDISRDKERYFSHPNQPYYTKGNSITYYIPFIGDSELFYCRPSTFSYNVPQAKIIDGDVVINIQNLDNNAETIKKELNNQINKINQFISYGESEISTFNNSLKEVIKGFLHERKKVLQKQINLINDLGYPLKNRSNIPDTFHVPLIKKVIEPTVHKAFPNKPPEPILDIKDYSNILNIISNMSITMERSPATFIKLSEEEIRDHFLMHLNGHYEGQATGETFNYEGKTDILIRDNGKNIFIAECKIWKGSKKLSETINQLLGYTSWRDTKTAILLFNRNKNFTNILNEIPGTVKQHSNFKEDLGNSSETYFKYKFVNKDDSNRELYLSILAFNIPQQIKGN